MSGASKATGLVGLAAALVLGIGSSRQAEAATKHGFQIAVGHPGNGFSFSYGQPSWQSYGSYSYVQPYVPQYQTYYVPQYQTYYVPQYPTYGYNTWRPRPQYRPRWRRNHRHGRRHRR